MAMLRYADDADVGRLTPVDGGIGSAVSSGVQPTSPTPPAPTAPTTTPAKPTGMVNDSGMGSPAYVPPTTVPQSGIGAAVGSTTAPSAPSGAPNWSAYLAANPDVAAEAQKNLGQFGTPEAYAEYHYQHYGQSEGRNLPTIAPAAPAPATPVTPASPAPTTAPGNPATPTSGPPVVISPTSAAPAPLTRVAGFAPDGSYTAQNDSVVDAVNRVASSGSPLMTRAAGIGAAVANSRGLQNSSIAAQSAQKAALDAAVPIASQEAQQAHQKNLQFLQGNQQTDIQRLQNANQSDIARLQSDTSKTIATQQLAGASQSAFAQALLAASQSYDANVSAIMSNPDLKEASRQAALNAAASQRNADYNMIQRVYGVSLSGSNTLTWTGNTGS